MDGRGMFEIYWFGFMTVFKKIEMDTELSGKIFVKKINKMVF